MANFLEYLQSLRSFVGKLDVSTKLYLTAGNDSCDMDSIACALAHAYMLSQTLHTDDAFSLPLLQCSRSDLRLRQEVVWLFKELDIDPDTLLYYDDFSAEILSSVNELSITLVDHNSPKGLLERFKPNIIEVIDHHEQTESILTSGSRITIESVGSCSTLVAERILSNNAGVMDEKLATLLLASILLDTGDLKLHGQVTSKDNAVAEQLLQRVASKIDRVQFYSELFQRRFDISHLTTSEILRKDFKIACVNGAFSFGFCTVATLLSDFLRRSDIFQDLSYFYNMHNLDALLLLGIYISDCDSTKKQRQIAIFRPSSESTTLPVPHLLESLASALEDDPDLKCDRINENIEGFDGILLEQGNAAIARKQIIPKITQFVASVEGERAPSTSHVHMSAAVLDLELSAPIEPTVTVLTKSGNEKESNPSGAVHVKYKTEMAPNIPEYSFKQEAEDLRKHRLVQIGEEEKNIDMDVVQPYRKIVQHAGYVGPKRQALVVISACYLPPHSLPNYSKVMEHVFFYIMSVLDKLVMDEYIIIYLHSGAPHNSMPSIRILHKFYKMVDRRLRKQLMYLYIVHPTFWVKAMIRLARPVISGKFWRKVNFIATLQDLSSHISVEDTFIAAPVLAVDKVIMSRRPARRRYQPEQDKPDQQDQDLP